MLDCAQVAAHFRRAAATLPEELAGVVATVITAARIEAKSYIGHQQESWPRLSDATILGFFHERGFWIPGKADLGFAPPDYEPLLRTGQMRDSISTAQDGLVGIVGSDDKVMLFQEMGTPGARYPIPPRPTLALALMSSTHLCTGPLTDILAAALVPD